MSAATHDIASTVAALAGPEWVRDVRQAALARFVTMGWPTAQDEEFRRSDPSGYAFDELPLPDVPWTVATGAEPEAGVAGRVTVAAGGRATISLNAELAGRGVIVSTFGQELDAATASAVRQQLLDAVERAENRIQLWHFLALTEGVVVRVPRFVEIADPLYIDVELAGDEELVAPHIAVVLDEGARVRIGVRYGGAADGEVLLNDGATASVGDGGHLQLFAVQDLGLDASVFSNSFASVGRDATARVFTGALGAMFAKYRTDVHMVGAGGDAFIGGVYFPAEDQHVDLRTVQSHRGPKAHSLTLYKGAATDEAHSVYQGLIHVDHDALDTDAYLTNNNLLLSDEARSDSIPTLQINTNEVRCSHGSTTGRLDANQLYYLESRGYPPDEARHLLVEGFFEEIIAEYPEPLAELIRSVVEERIGANESE